MKKRENKIDKLKNRFKEHPIGFFLSVVFFIVVSLGLFTDSLDKAIEFAKKYFSSSKQEQSQEQYTPKDKKSRTAHNSALPNHIEQKTEGNQSPAVISGGDVNINIENKRDDKAKK